jgi:hypothetical protein
VISGREMSEPQMLEECSRLMRERDPDVIEGHNIFRFDLAWPRPGPRAPNGPRMAFMSLTLRLRSHEDGNNAGDDERHSLGLQGSLLPASTAFTPTPSAPPPPAPARSACPCRDTSSSR